MPGEGSDGRQRRETGRRINLPGTRADEVQRLTQRPRSSRASIFAGTRIENSAQHQMRRHRCSSTLRRVVPVAGRQAIGGPLGEGVQAGPA